jgi:uncharacterized protein (DUF433 family)
MSDRLHPDRIVRDPYVLGGKPRIEGTRITVERILEDLADGHSVEDVVTAYQGVSVSDVHSALAYAARYMANEGLIAAE